MKEPGAPLLRSETRADSFTELVRRVEPGLRRALTAAFGPEIGREATAECLAYGWQHWSRIQGMKNPAGYLYRVGENQAKRLRGSTLPGVRDLVDAREPWAEPGFSRAWSALSYRQRVVVGLVHGFDWTLAEVADLLGISKGSVQTYERRGLNRLRRELGVKP